MSPFEPQPRWQGAPPVCTYANLLAFETWALAEAFLKKHCGEALLQWRCRHCRYWHFWTKPYPPAGSSSGTTRDYIIPQHALDLYIDSTV